MKLFRSAVLLSAIAAVPTVHADVLGVGASIGYWDSDLSGKAAKGGDQVNVENELDLSNNTEANLSAYLEHPIPLLPNVRLSYVKIDQTGRGELSTGFDDIPAGVGVDSSLDWRQTDLTLYYEVLDNWVNLDLGVTARDLDAELQVSDTAGLTNSKTEVDAVVPMGFAAARFDLPLTGVSVGANGNFISYSGDSVYDYDVYGQYAFAGVQLRAGYREMAVDYEDGDDRLDIDIGGPFASVGFSF
ncbi:TIGR04219 family outer membrane beta-barrel protein [Marinobacter bryozoorum]|uniref:TIGR04219 family outer membrane beta-barrel protein n=1 Tax=Marinobacter bryozoorum TaxID=256324 RepID=UPI002005926C|nr:TIGR04219 family outer membrane beta-barrel protein [Marinobacter bryozoorum]MCK7544158.1 TIGR04219 family outer membrane beta-barrel protein [Marinobacter bryozoorum]